MAVAASPAASVVLLSHHADGRARFHGIIDRLDQTRHYRVDWNDAARARG